MAERTAAEWKMASQIFDTVAEEYDCYRPGYPVDLVNSLISLTGLPAEGNILEVGAGTGKATRSFAERGYSLTCIEPGANLAAVAARSLKGFPRVRFENCRFEDWTEQAGRFDMVISAQAFHWIPKETGYAKAAAALKHGGSIALFWNLYPGLPDPINEKIQSVYHSIASNIASPVTKMEDTIRMRASDISESGFFGPVMIKRFPWSIRYTAHQYQGLLHTYSDHLALPQETQQRLFQAVAQVIDQHGGFIERPYVAVLFVAQKLPAR